MLFKSATWARMHNYVSAFFMPLAVIFILTGALYLLGVHDTIKEQRVDFQFDRSLLQDPAALTVAVKGALEEKGLRMPAGPATAMKEGYAWGNRSGPNVQLTPDRKSGKYLLTVNTPGLYDKLFATHKGKAGTLFTIFALLLSAALLLTYFSGIFLALKNARTRRPTLLAITCGFASIIVLLFLSF